MFIRSILNCTETTGTIEIAVSAECGADQNDASETFSLSPGEWKRLTARIPLKLLDEITEEIYDELYRAAERTKAVRLAAKILCSGDKSAREILQKLTKNGLSKESSEHAVNFLKKRGFLKEADACIRISEHALRSKHYGPRRIVRDLMAHGYSSIDAESAVASIPKEDFTEALEHNIMKKFPNIKDYPRAEREKAIASLIRLGFSAGEIIEFIKTH